MFRIRKTPLKKETQREDDILDNMPFILNKISNYRVFYKTKIQKDFEKSKKNALDGER